MEDTGEPQQPVKAVPLKIIVHPATSYEWTFFGDGNWHGDNGILYENRGGYYASVAYMYDFGQRNKLQPIGLYGLARTFE